MVCPGFGAFYSIKGVTLLWKRADEVTQLQPGGEFLEQLLHGFSFFYFFS